jgi:hypothetical protein
MVSMTFLGHPLFWGGSITSSLPTASDPREVRAIVQHSRFGRSTSGSGSRASRTLGLEAMLPLSGARSLLRHGLWPRVMRVVVPAKDSF